jgi:hypothetical protein
MDAEILLSAELREYNTYFNITKAILDGATKMNEIAGKARVDITNISKYLKVLPCLSANLVCRFEGLLYHMARRAF